MDPYTRFVIFAEAKMSLLTVAKLAGLSLSRRAAPAMSTAASTFKETLLNVPSTEVTNHHQYIVLIRCDIYLKK